MVARTLGYMFREMSGIFGRRERPLEGRGGLFSESWGCRGNGVRSRCWGTSRYRGRIRMRVLGVIKLVDRASLLQRRDGGVDDELEGVESRLGTSALVSR